MSEVRFPYRISNIEKLSSQGFVFVDKTYFIEKLEQNTESYVSYPRPRKFGKSLWLSILELSTKTNNNGFYQLNGIQSGIYTLKVYRKDYVPYVLNDVQVEENTNYTYKIELHKTPPSPKPDKKHIVGKIDMRD